MDVPDLSSIMKELKGIGTHIDRFSKTGEFEPSEPGKASYFLSQRQQRTEKHLAMMNRLNVSKNTVNDLLSINGIPSQVEAERVNEIQGGSSEVKSRFIPPKIKYRHLESKEKMQMSGDLPSKTLNTFVSSHRETKDMSTQYEEIEQGTANESTVSRQMNETREGWKEGRICNNQDILERYYDICSRRKRPLMSKEGETESRFTRGLVPLEMPKREGKINQAMEILLKK